METMHADLWQRIDRFEFDVANDKLPFSARLARENNWSLEYARRAIEEYKKFVFLAMCAGHPVTPSDQIDQVWHLHLTYTHSYWHDWCGRILPRPLHHGPTRGGAEEGRKFHDWYQRTLDSYRHFFGGEPPRDWWPPAEVRFGDDIHFVRLNTRRHWIIAKPFWLHSKAKKPAASTCSWLIEPRKYLQRALGTLLILLIAGCTQATGKVPVFDWNGPQFLTFYIVFAPLVLLAARLWRDWWRMPDDEVLSQALPHDAYEIALLAGGDGSALLSAVVELAQRRWLVVEPGAKLCRAVATRDVEAQAQPLERAILRVLDRTPEFSLAQLHSEFPVQSALETLSDRLRAAGFFVSRTQAILSRNATLGLALLAPLVGAIKIVIGLSRDRPVGFVMILTLGAFVAAGKFFALPQRSRRGDKALRRLRQQHAALKTSRPYADAALRDQNGVLALAVGLYGLEVLRFALLSDSDLQRNLRPASNNDGGDGASDGGGSGGGGCGGCGGGGCGGGGCGGGD